ncbi:T-cell surface glycoprotein CD8 alpha chain isoform X1 [Plectropomus leopardus]|uniref:T-cell surface glycoprotein CD8 alpha chain isoform X1 n=1 Tax=Plectropomus leopardus TaxID=160734 RepID=UPI001C4D3738|nr:T-cell surface glycoprotein CD8 alpha chain isoform X1 [Plectropomus leopardus]XP_042358243.1 T-cell surface glycoprotein CD8 alpha chain isoform X1 [Plectropomus leopardus]
MILLPLAWTLVTVSLWTSGLSQILQQDPINVLYPKILSTEIIECNCANITCDSVYWFRSISNHLKVEFLGRCNSADRVRYGANVDEARFSLHRKSGASFALRIINVTEEDTGIYSCVLKDRKNTEMWKPGILLRPGVIPPTLPPKTKPKPPVKSVCRCPKKNSKQDGCGSLVLWPLVGIIAALAFALICTLYYFSRLPKKCRHQFGKKR